MGRPLTLRDSLPGLGRLTRRFWPYLGRERPVIVASLFALYVEIGLRLLEPWPLKVVLDRVVATARGRAFHRLPILDAVDPGTVLALSALAVIVFAGLRALAAYYNTVGFALVGNRVLTAVRSELYSHLQRLSLSFHTGARSGDLIVRVTSDVGLLQDVAVTALLPLFANALTLVGMAAVMLWLNAPLTLLALATGPLFWMFTTRRSRRIRETARRQRQQEGAMAATAAESIGAVKVIHALSLEGTFARAFTGQSRKNLATGVYATRLSAGLERTVDLLIAVGTALVLWFGARLVQRGTMTPGDLIVFLAYLKNAYRPVKDFVKYTGRLAKASAAGERVLDLLDRTPDVRDLPGAVPAPALRGAVRFEGISFAYEPGRPALEQVDCEVQPGQHVALVGPSGSGKSTFVSLILRLYDPTAGRVLIDGRDIRDYTLASLRAQTSVVLQDSILFAATIWDNIAYGAPGAPPEAIAAAARIANAHAFIEALPHGYDTVVGERGVTLSSGQRQRIAIARAAIRRAPVLIFDEPTTGLDGESERAVIEALDRLAQGWTTFLITHDLRLAARADLILYLEDGRVRERGTHGELLQADGRYASLYRVQTASAGGGTPPPPHEPPQHHDAVTA
jgi:ATP-binding cassette subfamily B protein